LPFFSVNFLVLLANLLYCLNMVLLASFNKTGNERIT